MSKKHVEIVRKSNWKIILALIAYALLATEPAYVTIKQRIIDAGYNAKMEQMGVEEMDLSKAMPGRQQLSSLYGNGDVVAQLLKKVSLPAVEGINK